MSLGRLTTESITKGSKSSVVIALLIRRLLPLGARTVPSRFHLLSALGLCEFRSPASRAAPWPVPFTEMEAPIGIEPMIEDLQSPALPLGYGALKKQPKQI